MPSRSEVRGAFNRFVQRARYSDYRPMLTGRKLSDGTVTLADAPQGKTWVRSTEDSRELTAAWGYCSQVNVQVLVGYNRGGELEIKGGDYNATAQQIGAAALSIFTPPIVGELTNISIAGLNFKPGRLRPYGSGLYVTADPFHHEGGYWEGDPALNLSSNVPGTSGEARWVVVMLDPTTNTLTATNGTAQAVASVRTLAEADIAGITTPTGTIRLGAVALYNGQTTIDNTSRFVDIREFIAPRAAAVTGYNPIDLYYTTDTTLTDGDITNQTRISVDASGGPVTITLPALATMNNYPVSITKIDSSGNTVTIDGNGAETIIGSAQVIIEYQWTTVTLIYNSAAPGSEWILV